MVTSGVLIKIHCNIINQIGNISQIATILSIQLCILGFESVRSIVYVVFGDWLFHGHHRGTHRVVCYWEAERQDSES